MKKSFIILLVIPTILLSQNYLDEKIVNETFVELLNKDRKKLHVKPLSINYSVRDFTNSWTQVIIEPFIREYQKMDRAFEDAWSSGVKKFQYQDWPTDLSLHGSGENSFESRLLNHFNTKNNYGENMAIFTSYDRMEVKEITTKLYEVLKDSKQHYGNMTLKTYNTTHISIYEKEVDGRYYYVICQLLKS